MRALLTVVLAQALLTVVLAQALLTVVLAQALLTVVLAQALLTVVLAQALLTVVLAQALLTVVLAQALLMVVLARALLTVVLAQALLTVVLAQALLTVVLAQALLTVVLAQALLTVVLAQALLTVVLAQALLTVVLAQALLTVVLAQAQLMVVLARPRPVVRCSGRTSWTSQDSQTSQSRPRTAEQGSCVTHHGLMSPFGGAQLRAVAPGAPTADMFFSFDRISRTIEFTDCEPLLGLLGRVLAGWRFREAPVTDGQRPIISLSRTRDGYKRTSLWLKNPSIFSDPVDAVCDLIVDLIRAVLADDPTLLCLHGAAVELDGGLIVFPCTRRAGKSTLSVHLAARGAHLFADDVLPIERATGFGRCFGVMPRLRLPLPGDASDDLLDFIDRRKGPLGKRYLYLSLAAEEVAQFWATAPIRAFVLLQRDTEAPRSCELSPVSKSEVLKGTILQNFARDLGALEILDRLQAVVERSPCYALRYATTEQAAKALERDLRANASIPDSAADAV